MVTNRGKNKHVALIVEDDLRLAEALGDLLKSLGHDFIHTETQEEGLRLMEDGQFCFAILDLQIKVDAEAVYPMVEAGEQLQRQIRERYPHRNADDHHHLQILAMSGHAKEMNNVIQMLQNGADDFVVKPLGENTPPLHVKIQECLRKSGRENHKACARIMEMASSEFTGKNSQPSQPKRMTELSGTKLTIPGEVKGKRTEVRIGGNPVFLTNSSFVLLLKMMILRIGKGDAWANKSDLDPSAAEGWKGMSRLNAEIRPHLPGIIDIHENDKKGGYRLNPAIKPSDIDHDQLAGHWFKEVKILSNEIKEMRDV
jgi:DNA-binding response OmpR family regulator